MSKDYLDRYRDKKEETRKVKKSKSQKFVGSGLKIVDTDGGNDFFPAIAPSTLSKKQIKKKLQGEEEDFNLLDPDELPQIANVVDERPIQLQLLEEFRESNKWKAVTLDDRKRDLSSSDSDQSPSRARRRAGGGKSKGNKKSRQGKTRVDTDSDYSPPRARNENRSPESGLLRGSRRSDSDASPPRIIRSRSSSPSYSPPRRSNKQGRGNASGPSFQRDDDQNNADSSSTTRWKHLEDEAEAQAGNSGRMTKTLDGKKAGLQSAKALKDELLNFKSQEKERFERMDDSVSGRYAKTQFRDRETGRLRDLEAESEQKLAEEKKAAERKAQYDKWGKGLKQVEEQQERVSSAMHEMSKPLARYKDDDDLDAHLRNVERDGDPMLKFLAKKKAQSAGPSKPVYQGPAPAPNRFKIMPGYRWDGVDRSNGYEKEWFQKANSKKALLEESYKWSVEDL